VDVCRQTLIKLLLLQFFSDSHKTWQQDLFANTHKSGTHFRNLDFKNFGDFFKISHLDLVSGPAAVEQSRPTGLCQEIKFRIVVARQSMI